MARRIEKGRKPAKRRLRTAKQARSRATVEAILTAAARILAANGWSGFTTNAVAQRAGVSIGSLYEYFPDKQAIAAAIMDRHLSRAEHIVTARLTPGETAPSQETVAETLVAGFVDLHADDPRLHRVLSSDVPLDAKTKSRIARLGERVTLGVATALKGKTPNPELSARLLVDAADALTHRWIVDASGKPVDAQILAAELETMFGAYLSAATLRGSVPGARRVKSHGN